MLAVNIISTVVAFLVIGLFFAIGFMMGYGQRRLRNLLAELRQDFDERRAIEDSPESAVADSSPGHLKAKRAQRIERGEDPDDDGESQIVNTKSPAQFAAEADAAKEEKLDRWMPGVKHGK